MIPHAVRMRGVTKSFNGIRVLYNVDFDLRAGEIHALLGGNGAGKSTLMKILEGVYTPDEGTIEIAGRQVRIQTPQDARANGIAMIFQEFSLIPTLTVAQNVYLTREPRTSLGLLSDKESERRTRALFEDIGVDIDPNVLVADLSTGYRQLTEIAKALSQNARVLIMDEPTSSLTTNETQSLFQLIGRLKKRGISIIYISHRMEETFEIADRITVLRDGRVVVTDDVANIDLLKVIEYIVGHRVQSFEWHERQVDRSGTPLLEVLNLSAGKRVKDISFRLYRGEILGIAGLMGSGRTELARAIFGVDQIDHGKILVRGQEVTLRRPSDAMKAGIALIPEDRRNQGLVLDHSIRDNFLLPILNQLRVRGLLNDVEGKRRTETFVNKLALRTDSIDKPVRMLSGGNQQKVVIGKWLAAEPEILVMDEPTAGIDIQTKTEIVTMIRQLADAGNGIIVISSELSELLAVSDRILVLRGGVFARELYRRELDSPVDSIEVGEASAPIAEETLQRLIQGV